MFTSLNKVLQTGARSLQWPLVPEKCVHSLLIERYPEGWRFEVTCETALPYDHPKLKVEVSCKNLHYYSLFVYLAETERRPWVDTQLIPRWREYLNTLRSQRKQFNQSVCKQTHYESRSSSEIDACSTPC
jgi:hypothetical protein